MGVIAALKKERLALEYALEELRADRDVVLAALEQRFSQSRGGGHG